MLIKIYQVYYGILRNFLNRFLDVFPQTIICHLSGQALVKNVPSGSHIWSSQTLPGR